MLVIRTWKENWKPHMEDHKVMANTNVAGIVELDDG